MVEREKCGHVEPGDSCDGASVPHRGLVPIEAFRSKDSLLEVGIAEPTGGAAELIDVVREYWAVLRDHGFADSNPVKVLFDAGNRRSVIWVFRWKMPTSRMQAAASNECVGALAAIERAGRIVDHFPFVNEAYQGFETRRFPPRGGVELLRGKCTCTVKLDGFDTEFELEGQNGFVIMHRGPRHVQQDVPLMPVTILRHGADAPNPLRGSPGLKDAPEEVRTTPFRVEQNSDLPQFGIIRSLQKDRDFPAVAMWVVHWVVHTPIGTLVTDPKQPLVFGPTVVRHYPPVGTEFFSAVGPVPVYKQEDGQRVGTLTPGQLTAFDIVVTMDDEIPSILDRPARYHVEMFNRYIDDPALEIPLEGLVNDYRVPEDPAFGAGPQAKRRRH
ncbi:hypothetical protein ACIPYQ_24940 [Streptomyces sp. NPDC090045]|uniref:hypothetical protein n=1 Tax=Streptomyces sp. NPDC090045 TaxID=3365927 RepID=UPI00382DF36D